VAQPPQAFFFRDPGAPVVPGHFSSGNSRWLTVEAVYDFASIARKIQRPNPKRGRSEGFTLPPPFCGSTALQMTLRRQRYRYTH